MKRTFKQIIDDLELFATNHKQINSFGFGNADNITNKDQVYPMMWVQSIPSTTGNMVDLTFEIYLIDLLKQDKVNLVDVLSDTLLMGNDVVAKYFDDEDEYDFTLNEDGVVITPFEAEFDDFTAGWIFEVNIEIQNDLNDCEIPENE